MNILATQYTLATKSFEIYVAGCKGQPHCKGCHNPESWDFNQGEKWCNEYYSKLYSKIAMFDAMINKIMIFGGEPLDQPIKELENFLLSITIFGKEVWIFTRYDLNEIPESIKKLCDFIKCGRYIEEFKTEDNIKYGIKLATSNQNVYKKGIDYY